MKKALLVAGLLLALWGINYPFAGGYNANNNYLTLAAKNLLRFGVIPTYFAGKTLPIPIPFYLHHPILVFILSAIPFILFGFHNWVVHAANFIFIIGDLFLLYKIGEFAWNKKIGLWAAGIAAIFPIFTYFWKYIFFEQGSMFFMLCVIYFLLYYFKKPSPRYLLYIFVFALLAGFTDWGVLYLLVPLLVFGRKVTKPLIAYSAAAAVSIGLFLLTVYLLRAGFGDLRQAISVHAYTPQLFRLSAWPLRLILITIVRFAIYFTPLSFLWFGYVKKNRLLLCLFLLGCMNIVVLPTVTWENSYFLFYFIPFLAFAGALWMEKHAKWWIVAAIIIWSITVNFLKLAQIKKQFWQYDAAVAVNKEVPPYETVGVINFSGDILEQYFYHPTQPMTPAELPFWQAKKKYTDITYVVDGGKLITRSSPMPKAPLLTTSPAVTWYRMIRDMFNVGQL